jgi:predicted transcriptional regulator of viral defense system
MPPSPKALAHAERVFRQAGGILRTRDALRRRIHPRTLYGLRDLDRLTSLGRGVWYLVDAPASEHLDLIAVALRYPRAVICLTSALSWHGLTTQLPTRVHIALPPGFPQPRTRFPPVRAFRFSGRAYTAGVETHALPAATLRVYGVAKTVADCFKFRNYVGLDVALEALREGWRKRRFSMDELWRSARICRVDRVMRPYLEALV